MAFSNTTRHCLLLFVLGPLNRLFGAVSDGRHLGKGLHGLRHLELAAVLVWPSDVIARHLFQGGQNRLHIAADITLVCPSQTRRPVLPG